MKDGGPVFPRGVMGGITLRQWYKGMVANGILAKSGFYVGFEDDVAICADALLREDEEAGK